MRKGSKSFAQFCREKGCDELLALYDDAKSEHTAEETSYSNRRPCVCTCPTCGSSWDDCTNKLSGRKAGKWNYFTKSAGITYCPYCKGERVSPFYNLAVVYPEIIRYFDFEYLKNKKLPHELSPGGHEEIYVKCANPECDYKKETSVRALDFVRGLDGYRCPKCEGGKNNRVNEHNNLQVTDREVALELYDPLNGGITGRHIRRTSHEKMWFQCPNGHIYSARVSNRCYRGDGCPVCSGRTKTSFMEQAIFYYVRKCFPDAVNRYMDPRTKREIDIFIPSIGMAVEYSSFYQHRERTDGRRADLGKLKALSAYYFVYTLQEYPAEVKGNPLLETIELPVFRHGKKQYEAMNRIIGDFIEKLVKRTPGQEFLPVVDLERDLIRILCQYVSVPLRMSFMTEHPELAGDWHPTLNGHLTPDMFTPSNGAYRFWWICRSCGRAYQASMNNRTKTNPEKCGCCSRANAELQGGETLGQRFPELKPFWHKTLNPDGIEAHAIWSKEMRIFCLPGDRIAAIKISSLTQALQKKPGRDIREYLENAFEKSQRDYIIEAVSMRVKDAGNCPKAADA